MPDAAQRIAENVVRIRERIAAAAQRSARPPDAITLVAVTKYVGPAEVAAVLAAGCRDLGESRPQELWRKTADCAVSGVRWHLIGHLQRNKAKRTLPLISLMHSGDSLRLLETVSQLSQEADRTTDILLEVNISGEEAKHGFAPQDVEPALPQLAQLPRLRIRGLMTMSRLGGTTDETREDFAQLRQLRDKLLLVCPSQIALHELSMGMSGDFEAAIAEGATLIRIGSALFEGLAP
jgi:pyridoxal phosphate enzyme (YggS family)